MIRELSRPFRPVELGTGVLEFFQLRELGEKLRNEDEYQTSGVAAVSLARDEHVTLLLVALRQGAVMREHRAPSAAAVVLLAGQATFATASGERTELGPGSLAVFSADVSHAVEADEDALYLVVIGGRERPSNAA